MYEIYALEGRLETRTAAKRKTSRHFGFKTRVQHEQRALLPGNKQSSNEYKESRKRLATVSLQTVHNFLFIEKVNLEISTKMITAMTISSSSTTTTITTTTTTTKTHKQVALFLTLIQVPFPHNPSQQTGGGRGGLVAKTNKAMNYKTDCLL